MKRKIEDDVIALLTLLCLAMFFYYAVLAMKQHHRCYEASIHAPNIQPTQPINNSFKL